MSNFLSGVTVVDTSRVLSGPFSTQQLADQGARVIKIEHPRGGDDTRRFGPPFIEGESTYFMSVNRGKESVAIDLKRPEGFQILLRLLKNADVLVENFRPGAATRLGLAPSNLWPTNPQLIVASISGFGQTGAPDYQGRGGYDLIIQAVSGLMSLTGEPDGESTRVGIAISDLVAGLYAAQGILGALHERARTGRGVHLDISMQDAMASIMSYAAGHYFGVGESPPRMGNAHPSICPYETVQTKDGPLALAVANDGLFERLVNLLGRPELLEDPRFGTAPERVRHRPELLPILEAEFAKHEQAYWEKRLVENGIPAGPVLSVPEALDHPQLQARGSILNHEHPVAGTIRTVASPVRNADERPQAPPPPPTLGQHTDAILREIGYADPEIADLRRDAIVA